MAMMMMMMMMMMRTVMVWRCPDLEVPSFASAQVWKCPQCFRRCFRKAPERLLEMFLKRTRK
eukprot:2585891-Karenia_brevis.AAC.1